MSDLPLHRGEEIQNNHRILRFNILLWMWRLFSLRYFGGWFKTRFDVFNFPLFFFFYFMSDGMKRWTHLKTSTEFYWTIISPTTIHHFTEIMMYCLSKLIYHGKCMFSSDWMSDAGILPMKRYLSQSKIHVLYEWKTNVLNCCN